MDSIALWGNLIILSHILGIVYIIYVLSVCRREFLFRQTIKNAIASGTEHIKILGRMQKILGLIISSIALIGILIFFGFFYFPILFIMFLSYTIWYRRQRRIEHETYLESLDAETTLKLPSKSHSSKTPEFIGLGTMCCLLIIHFLYPGLYILSMWSEDLKSIFLN